MSREMTNHLPERIGGLERKVDALSASVDRQFAEVADRFNRVDGRFEAIDRRFEAVDRRFETTDRRFEVIDRRLDAIDRRFDEVTAALVEQRAYTEFAFARLHDEMNRRFELVATKAQVDRIEQKLDTFIDSVSVVLRAASTPRRKRR